jgi:Aldehyde dehydrogenase family
VFGAVGTAGQRCTTTRRLFLQRGIAARFTEALAGAYRQVKIGDPLDEDTIMGPLLNRRAVTDMMDGLGRIREQGGEVIFGGERMTGCFVQPTLVRARANMPILKEEIFAPILYLVEFDTSPGAFVGDFHYESGLRGDLSQPSRQRLRHREYQPGNQRRGDRRRIRRREGDRRRTGIRQRRVEGLYAETDEYHQLVGTVAAGAGDQV